MYIGGRDNVTTIKYEKYQPYLLSKKSSSQIASSSYSQPTAISEASITGKRTPRASCSTSQTTLECDKEDESSSSCSSDNDPDFIYKTKHKKKQIGVISPETCKDADNKLISNRGATSLINDTCMNLGHAEACISHSTLYRKRVKKRETAEK